MQIRALGKIWGRIVHRIFPKAPFFPDPASVARIVRHLGTARHASTSCISSGAACLRAAPAERRMRGDEAAGWRGSRVAGHRGTGVTRQREWGQREWGAAGWAAKCHSHPTVQSSLISRFLARILAK